MFDVIEPGDIRQGALGNCYFLSAISSLAEYPERIKKVFLTDYTNAPGVYAVELCVNGEMRNVVVDDFFPVF